MLEAYGRHKFKSFEKILKIVIWKLEDLLDHIFIITYLPLNLRIYKYILNPSKDFLFFLLQKCSNNTIFGWFCEFRANILYISILGGAHHEMAFPNPPHLWSNYHFF